MIRTADGQFDQMLAAIGPNNAVVKKLQCAAKYGQKHSIGALFGGGTVANFLGGNSVAVGAVYLCRILLTRQARDSDTDADEQDGSSRT